MNILFFLTPKDKVAYIYDTFSLRQAMEKMEYHKYSAIPILDSENRYSGTITEGDLLWAIKNDLTLNLAAAEEYPISKVSRRMDNQPININMNMEDLVGISLKQNFVPVTDDRNIFIGIVTRSDILKYFYSKLGANE